jgi:primary-amine oxidase
LARRLCVAASAAMDTDPKTAEHARVGVRHPLDPLTAEEIEAACRILKQDLGLAASARFVYVTLREPAKDAVLRYRRGDAFEREAHVVLRERVECRTYEAVVSITAGEVRLWRELPGVQPAVMLEEFLATEATVKKDARWQEAMRRRGITDFDMVMIDPWSVGYAGPEDAAGEGRFLRPLTWVRQGDPDDNGYARPVEGLIVRFDLDRMEVVDIEDHGVVPLPPHSGNYTPDGIRDAGNVPHFPEGLRQDLKPVEITQPEGTRTAEHRP